MNARRDFLAADRSGRRGRVRGAQDRLARRASSRRRRAVADRPAADVAADEGYWREIQQAFTLDRTIINLNNGYTCPSPRVVHEALKRYLDISNQAPIHLHVEPARAATSSRCAASSPPRSAATPRSWRSRATRARRCRSASSAST